MKNVFLLTADWLKQQTIFIITLLLLNSCLIYLLEVPTISLFLCFIKIQCSFEGLVRFLGGRRNDKSAKWQVDEMTWHRHILLQNFLRLPLHQEQATKCKSEYY
jgi:hypothetical protein